MTDGEPRKAELPSPLDVLIVEDEPSHAELMAQEHRRAGFAFEWRRVETEAAYLDGLTPPRPDSLGLFAAAVWRTACPGSPARSRLDIPFIVVSAMVGEDAAVDLMKRGAADYLLKDRLPRLGQAVERTLDLHRLRREKNQADDDLWASAARLESLFSTAPCPTGRTSK